METADVEDGSSNIILMLLAAVVSFILLPKRRRADLKNIPTIGQSNYLCSYIDALKTLFSGPTVVRKGYEKYHPGIFKIATLDRWLIVVTGTEFIEDIRKAPEDELSGISSPNEAHTSSQTRGFFHGPNHLASSPKFLEQIHSISLNTHEVLITHITRNLQFIVSDIRDEMISAFDDAMATANSQNTSGWMEFNALELISQIINRINNRVLVGLPLCRDPNFSSDCISMSRDVYQPMPPIPLFGPIVSFLNKIASGSFFRRRRARKLILRLIADCQRANVRRELSLSKPNDLLSWILQDTAKKASAESIVLSLLDICFSANIMLSSGFTHVLYHLAANSQYVVPMRREIDNITGREGWTKEALDKMSKVDSFIKESMRLNSISTLSMMRKTLKPFSFSNGTVIPPETLIFVAGQARHMDPRIYPTPDLFDGFRFSNLKKQQQENDSRPLTTNLGSTMSGARFKLVATTPDYLVWGYGRHACSGRFFAASVLKLVLAHVVLRYDVKLESVRPEDVVVSFSQLPNKVFLRKR